MLLSSSLAFMIVYSQYFQMVMSAGDVYWINNHYEYINKSVVLAWHLTCFIIVPFCQTLQVYCPVIIEMTELHGELFHFKYTPYLGHTSFFFWNSIPFCRLLLRCENIIGFKLARTISKYKHKLIKELNIRTIVFHRISFK